MLDDKLKLIGQSAIRNPKSDIVRACSSMEQERDSAKVEVARSIRARSASLKRMKDEG
jgi:hypothetical protein